MPPHLTEPKPDSPATMGGTHRLRPHLDGGGGRGACQPPPHLAEPLSDSPAKVGGAHWQAITPRQRGLPVTATPHGAVPRLARDNGRRAPASLCRPPTHRVEPFSDSPATVVGAHRQDSHGHVAPPPASPRTNYAHRTAVGPAKESEGRAASPPASPRPNCAPRSTA